MSTLNLGDGLKLPLDCVTQTFAILAKRGVGKTHTASVMAEEMLQAGQPSTATFTAVLRPAVEVPRRRVWRRARRSAADGRRRRDGSLPADRAGTFPRRAST